MNEADGCTGRTNDQASCFPYVDLEQRVPARHPLRAIRGLVHEALADIGRELEALADIGRELEAVYSRIGRP